jgi:hypothetical protein
MATERPAVTRLNLLAEQDFGSYEGKSHIPRRQESAGTQVDVDKDGVIVKQPETKEAMAQRMDVFLDEHLFSPAMISGSERHTVAIVSHALIMSVLWRRLLARLPSKSIQLAPELLALRTVPTVDRLPFWSNTGYLELLVQIPPTTCVVDATAENADVNSSKQVFGEEQVRTADNLFQSSRSLSSSTVQVQAINKVDHLKGFKRTGGGVGSSKHDEGQKTIETFFKRRKVA